MVDPKGGNAQAVPLKKQRALPVVNCRKGAGEKSGAGGQYCFGAVVVDAVLGILGVSLIKTVDNLFYPWWAVDIQRLGLMATCPSLNGKLAQRINMVGVKVSE